MMWARLWLVVCVVGCVKTNAVTCEDGRICPAGTLCDEIHKGCVIPAQLDACMAMPEGHECTAGSIAGFCRDGVCLAASCGDGFVNPKDGELCDGAPPPVACTELGFDRGSTTCSTSCSADTTGCAQMGWHRVGFESPDRLVAVFGSSATDVNAIGWYYVTSSGGGPAWWHYDGSSLTKRTMTLDIPPGTNADGHYEITDATGWGSEMIAVGYYQDYSDPNNIITTQTAMHFDGSTWTVRVLPSTGRPKAVWGTAATNAYAVTGQDEVIHWNGTSWTAVGTLTGGSLLDVWGAGSEIFAVGKAGRIEHFNGAWSAVGSPLPTTVDLHGVWGSSVSDVFAVGDGGTILHYNGSAWSVMASSTTLPLQGVWGLAPNNVYATGYGIVLHYDGVGWSTMSTPTEATIYAVWGASATDLHAVEWGDIVQYNGDGWEQPVAAPASAPQLASIYGFGANKIFVGEDDVWKFDGKTWASTGLLTAIGGPYLPYGPIQELWGSSDTDVYVAGGQLWHYNGTWSQITTYPGTEADGIWGTSATNVYVVGGSGVIYHLTGTTWAAESSGTTRYLEGAWGSGPNDVFVVGDNGTILHRAGSATWTPMTSPSTDYLLTVSGTGPTDVFAAGYGGTIIHYDGTAWTKMTSHVGVTINRVLAISPTDVFAIGTSGRMIHYDGAQWTPVRNPALAELNGIWNLGTTLYTVGTNSTMLELPRRTPW